MKKALSFLLAVIMIASNIVPTFAAEKEVGKTEAWNTSYTITGNGANDIVNIALKQENKTMSDLGFNIAWCALFVSKCASLAGQSDAIPNHSVVSTLYSKVKNAGGSVVTNPQKGDLIFYKCTTSNSWCHVGIMTDSVNSVQGNVANKVMYIDYKRYLDTNGSCWTATFVRPKYKGTNTTAYNINYNPYGGTGTMSATTINSGGKLTIPACKFTRDGYYFAGYNCYRKSDNTWYTDTAGWKTNTTIQDEGYVKKVYTPGNVFTFGTAWTNGASTNDTFTFHAVWLKDKPVITFNENISGSNYISSAMDNPNVFAKNYVSRDESIHTLSIDTTETLNNQNSLKIVSTTAGSTSSKDFAIATNTNAGMAEIGKNGDSGSLVMSFYAKSNIDGTKLNLRWGYSTKIHTITLTKQWKTYSVTMPKTIYYGAFIHGYLDRAATVHMNNIVVAEKYSSSFLQEDGSAPIEIEYTHGETIKELPVPDRQGYTFLGWFTKNVGGTRIDIGSKVPQYSTKLYAQWEKEFSQTPVCEILTLDGKLYECYDNPLSWEDAKAHCENLGGHLVTINNKEENDLVFDMIEGSGRFAWIGASYNTSNACWEWVTGEEFNYTNWIEGQPSNSQTSPEYYAQLMPFDIGITNAQGKWNDAMGGDGWFSHYGMKNASYICEYEPTEENTEPTESTIPTENTEPTDNTEPTVEPPIPDFPLGDADGDGTLSVLDATEIQKVLASLKNWRYDGAEFYADYDMDGIVTVLDATEIQMVLAGLK